MSVFWEEAGGKVVRLLDGFNVGLQEICKPHMCLSQTLQLEQIACYIEESPSSVLGC